jgi:acetyl-CoA carboxylase biotin carboxyl carrier protein
MTDSEHRASESGHSSNDASLNELPGTIASIVESMGRGSISRLVLSKGDFHLELEAAPRTSSGVNALQAAPTDAETGERSQGPSRTHVITSPMIGTFYAAPAPGEPPFIKLGDVITQGDTVGIVEAMKIMNEIAADRAGTVVQILASDGETVEYGSPLIEVDPSR